MNPKEVNVSLRGLRLDFRSVYSLSWSCNFGELGSYLLAHSVTREMMINQEVRFLRRSSIAFSSRTRTNSETLSYPSRSAISLSAAC